MEMQTVRRSGNPRSRLMRIDGLGVYICPTSAPVCWDSLQVSKRRLFCEQYLQYLVLRQAMETKSSATHETSVEGDEKGMVEQVERRRSVDGTALETKYACTPRSSFTTRSVLTIRSSSWALDRCEGLLEGHDLLHDPQLGSNERWFPAADSWQCLAYAGCHQSDGGHNDPGWRSCNQCQSHILLPRIRGNV